MSELTGNALAEQQEREQELDPEGTRSPYAPVAKHLVWHDRVYKSLATVGDFYCYIWFHDDDYDESRTTNGSKSIHIVPSAERLEDDVSLHKYLCATNSPSGTIYVNPIFRRNGGNFTSNRDVKDIVKFMNGVAKHYDADPNQIFVIDTEDNDKVYEMSYDAGISQSFSDVSNYALEDISNGIVGDGALSINYTTQFGSGSISMSSLKSAFNGGNSISGYYRGGAVVNISQNNNVPTSGTISFNNFRNTVSKCTALINGNWMHMKSRWEVFGDTIWTSNLNKKVSMGGHAGPEAENQPSIRFNNSGGGTIEYDAVAGHSRGHSGNRGGSGGGNGGNGGYVIHLAVPVKIDNDTWNNKIKGGGGGGGGGGNGGKGGNGGHNGHYSCGGWFCWSHHRNCHGNGGSGGNGGAGGEGGRGKGYIWGSANNTWYNLEEDYNQWIAGKSGGAGAQGGNNAGQGGSGGNGGAGGECEGSGSNGNSGNTGLPGCCSQHGCGGQGNGAGGNGGGSKGNAAGKSSYSHNGSRYT